jgi:proteasome lid subunit RPN8/RPN11
MFYFSINRKSLAKIRKEARSTDREIIGVLIGKVYDNLLVVTDAVSGEQASGMTRVKLDNVTLAKIVNKIMEGKIKGNILGWYHSHPGFGVFMSATDIGTQQMLQQFSSKVAALVIDPTEDHYEVFTLDSNNGVVMIPKEMVYKYKDGGDGIPPKLKEVHNFQAVMEVVPNHEVDKLRYFMEVTTPFWPEKKCLICKRDLKFDPLTNKWFCPESDMVKKAEEERKKLEQAKVEAARAEKEKRKKKKVQHKCAHCDKELKYSPKLGAWYCKTCRRVYKHRVKVAEEKQLEKDEDKERGEDEEQAGPVEELEEQRDVVVEAVEVMEEVKEADVKGLEKGGESERGGEEESERGRGEEINPEQSGDLKPATNRTSVNNNRKKPVKKKVRKKKNQKSGSKSGNV